MEALNMNSITEKKCIQCNQIKPISYYRDKRNTCRDCLNKYRREWSRNNADHESQTRKKYYKINFDKISKQAKAWAKNHVDAIKRITKERYERNKEDIKKKSSEYAKDNAEAVNEVHRKYYQKNIEHMRAMRKVYSGNRRSLVDGTYTLKEWQDLCDYYDNRCLKCGEQKKLTVDHVIPISLGGSNTIDNLQPLCDYCNKSKGAKHIDYR
jgi:5-methylcytosine-specific restriction endonuclease McrA